LKKPTKTQGGFTLIELVLVIIIVGIILAGSSNLMAQGFRSFIATRDILNENRQTSIAIESMIRDLHAIRSTSDITSASSATITFNDTAGNSIAYSKSGSILTRTENSEPQILADNLPDLSFEYYANNGTSISGATPSAIRYVTVNTGSNKPATTVYPPNLK